MTDLTAPNARAERDSLADRTEVLDKVKALILMPGTLYVTREMVANYFEVDVETIHKLVQRNRGELEANGLIMLRGQELVDMMSIANLDSRTRSLTVFTRRTVLDAAMLLRDSTVARRVRSHLLDVEQGSAFDLFGYVTAAALKFMTSNVLEPTLAVLDGVAPDIDMRGKLVESALNARLTRD